VNNIPPLDLKNKIDGIDVNSKSPLVQKSKNDNQNKWVTDLKQTKTKTKTKDEKDYLNNTLILDDIISSNKPAISSARMVNINHSNPVQKHKLSVLNPTSTRKINTQRSITTKMDFDFELQNRSRFDTKKFKSKLSQQQ